MQFAKNFVAGYIVVTVVLLTWSRYTACSESGFVMGPHLLIGNACSPVRSR